MTLSQDIKAGLPITDEFRRDGHELRKLGAQFVTLCPFHQEKTPSCHVSPEKGRFHCFGCGEDGTVIDYHAKKQGITPAEAIVQLAQRLQDSGPDAGAAIPPRAPVVPSKSGPRALPRLPVLEGGTPSDFSQLAIARNLSIEALQLASARGLLWFCDLADGPEPVRAWLITDRTRRNAQTRRLDGEKWKHSWDPDARHWVPVEPERRRKVRGFTGNQASWPVGVEEAQQFGSVSILEGVDLLAAFHFLIVEGRENQVGPVAILGAGNRICEEALTLFEGKRVRVFPHADANDAGLRAAANWEAQLSLIAESVDAFDFTGLTQVGGQPVKDLNDLTNIDCDCLDSELEVWALMNF